MNKQFDVVVIGASSGSYVAMRDGLSVICVCSSHIETC
jgi:pyruvate/2-oxoglutarate dehydrogenase complex dihydrolipoamide dehydrogenase (E3) component